MVTRVSKSTDPGFFRNRPAPAWCCVQRSTRRPASHLAEQGFPGCQELAPRVRGYHVGVPLSTSSNPIPPEAAISAFLRGIEPRAFVFARAQCGDEALARLALGATVADFRQTGAEKPLAHWPRDFWSALLAQPALLQGQPGLLPELDVGAHVALLLHLVVGLDALHAAQVLGVSEGVYRSALARAWQQSQAAGVSLDDLEALRERLQRDVKQLPATTLHPEAALPAASKRHVHDTGAVAVRFFASAATWPLLPRILLGLCALVLLLSFFWTPWRSLAPGESEALPPETIAPVAPADAVAVVTHPDFALLLVPADEALAQDMALYSWLADGGQADDATTGQPTLPESGQPESSAAASENTP